jgi:hypothetical protein
MKSARIVALVATLAAATGSFATAQDQTPLASNFLYNYYTVPGASAVQAGMYPAPHPVPANVGHTFYTYQPLMPHEHMYEHSRNYYNYYAPPETFYHDPCHCRGGGGGLNKTTVVWQNGGSHVGPFPFSGGAAAAFKYRVHSARYCLGHHGVHGFSLGGCATGDCGNCGCQ